MKRDPDRAALVGLLVGEAGHAIQQARGQRRPGQRAGDNAELNEVLGIHAGERSGRRGRLVGRLGAALEDHLRAGGQPRIRAVAQRHVDAQRLLEVEPEREAVAGAADVPQRGVDPLAALERGGDFEVGIVALARLGLDRQQGVELREYRADHLDRAGAGGGRRGGLHARGQILGEEIDRRLHDLRQRRHRRVMPQPFEPDHPIRHPQRGGQLLGTRLGNHVVVGPVEHEHLALDCPIAEARGVGQRIDLGDLPLERGLLVGRQGGDEVFEFVGFRRVVDHVRQIAAAQDQRDPGQSLVDAGRARGQHRAHADAHDADPFGVHLGPGGQQVDGAAGVLDPLRQRAEKQLGVIQQGSPSPGQASLAVVGQLEHHGRHAPRRQGRADHVLQLEIAVEDVQANHRGPLRIARLDSLGQIIVGRDRVVRLDRRDDRRRISQPNDAIGVALTERRHRVIERGVVVRLRHVSGRGRLGRQRQHAGQGRSQRAPSQYLVSAKSNGT